MFLNQKKNLVYRAIMYKFEVLKYVYWGNNPVRYVDPTGKYIYGTDGEWVTLTNGKLSSNAPTDVKTIGNAILLTPKFAVAY